MKIKRIIVAVLLIAILCINLTSCSAIIDKLSEGLNSTISDNESATTIEAKVNKITEEKMQAFVTIKAVFKKSTFMQVTTVNTQASGVVVSYNGKILVLTNNHAVTHSDGYWLDKLTVVDCFGKEFEAKIYKERGFYATASRFDLACLTVESFAQDHPSLKIADANPSVGEKVISISTPAGQANAISFGKITHYGPIDAQGTTDFVSNVEINVIWHTAHIRHGSSGGALVNYDLELIGIHFAGGVTEDNSFTDGFSIPVDSIMDFLIEYV